MKAAQIILIFLTILVSSCSNPDVKAQLKIVGAFPNLTFQQPVDIQNAGDETNRIFVVEQKGVIKVFQNNPAVNSPKIFLDISNRVLSGGEQGLLGLAFHPNYKDNGFFFIDYTAANPRRTIISRFKVSNTNLDIADKNSESVLLEVAQPFSNHNGGQVSFGPDGYLYVSFGDGGSGGDPDNNGQNLNTLLGSIIRIDINESSGNLNYSIPPDNPFVNQNDKRSEIYAYGLRNTWRFSFDKPTGKLWAADVGQNAWEEIDIIKEGGNYGWRIMEGLHCFNPSTGCNENGLEKPVLEYGHNSTGGYSITGGFVYRGQNAPSFINKYIYADFVSGNIWALQLSDTSASNKLLKNTNLSISTFGIDEGEELYFADYSAGKIYKFEEEGVSSVGSLIIPKFQLFNNYPNPFNPTTQISYRISESSFVLINIFNSLGELVQTLINDYKQPGIYNKVFDGTNLTSGLYTYQFISNNYIETKKMLLLK
ncbi:quinoprotein glucose dehydrogenase B precursor [bacterium BMS3Abin04]|nr:quinoprotein glucose dehydrogenase B precursor [bacterium BMS3Abin04]